MNASIFTQKQLALLLGSTALLASGCQSTTAQMAARPVPAAAYAAPGYPQAPAAQAQADGPIPYAPADYAQIQPAAGGYAPQGYMNQGLGAVQADMMKVDERLQRIERALLRLDRRMQLVERNELNRMDGGTAQTSQLDGAGQGVGAGGMAPVSANGMAPTQQASAGDQMPNYDQGFQPIAANGGQSGGITSALQAAAPIGQGGSYQMVSSAAPVSRQAGLPSLADPEPSMGRSPTSQKEGADLAVWTVRYDNTKIWPDRNELPASRDVVQALLGSNSGGQGVTLFARGNKPTSVVFRDRVKALSRYLAKVSSRDTLAIAALPAPHLDEDTIEIFATH